MNAAPSLALLRTGVDLLDDGMLLALAARRGAVALIGRRKRALGLALRDPARERRVHARAARLAAALGIPQDSRRALVELLIADACRQQRRTDSASTEDTAMTPPPPSAAALLGWLPPPARWRPLLQALPPAWPRRAVQAALARALAEVAGQGLFEPVRGRRIGIEVADLGLRWTCVLEAQALRVLEHGAAEATVAGSATDLLLLASRREDADTLFFQRRLRLTGDVELGLTLRNLLDRLPWESLPLGARIVLQRGAGLAETARAAHRRRAGHGAAAPGTAERFLPSCRAPQAPSER